MSSQKVLVISNNPLSNSSSNGRTLLNMLGCYNKDDLYNFFVNGNELELNKCHYYQISDKDAMKSWFSNKHVGKEMNAVPCTNNNGTKIIKNKNKNVFKVMLRDYIWNNKRIYKNVLKWCNSFKPDVILFQIGDCVFLINLVLKLHNDLNIPIVTYCSENYYFKNFNYYKCSLKEDLLYKKWHKVYKAKLNELIASSAKSIYLTDDLRKTYENEFAYHKGITIYNSSDIVSSIDELKEPNKHFIYSGNIGVGRLEELNKIGEIINQINPEYSLKIYSKLDKKQISDISKYKFIDYEGYVNYDENISNIKKAFAIILVDSFDEFYLKDTYQAFSTKIADSIGSLNCVIAYTPQISSMSNYLKSNKCAFVADNISELKSILKNLIDNPKFRLQCADRAFEIFNTNHSKKLNSEKMKNIINQSLQRPKFQLLVTTVNKNFNEMIEIANFMKIDSDAIIRSQCGINETKTLNFNGHKLMLVCANDKGLSKNRNELFKLSDSDYVMFSDDDEIFADDYDEKIKKDVIQYEPNFIDYSFSVENSKDVIHCDKMKRCTKKLNDIAMWALLFSSKAIKQFNLQFDERFGAGTTLDAGEDNIMRKRVNLIKKDHLISPFLIMQLTFSTRPSTCSWGENYNYLKTRCVLYGFLHQRTYLLYLFRLKLKLKDKKIISLKECVEFAREGKKYRKESSF